VLEDVWRETPGEPRLFLQGVVQAAVGLHHLSQRNLPGAVGVLSRALGNLSGYPAKYGDIALADFRSSLAACLDALEAQREPSMPKIERSETPTE
jgi:hypothetical protein